MFTISNYSFFPRLDKFDVWDGNKQEIWDNENDRISFTITIRGMFMCFMCFNPSLRTVVESPSSNTHTRIVPVLAMHQSKIAALAVH